jgi:putative phage-type endonuclease
MISKITTKNHEEWLALRKKYIGGSDASSVVGLNPWSSPYALWAEKTGKVPPFEGNLATDVGTYLEDFIAKRFESVTGKKVRRHNQSILNDKYPFAIANIDRDIVSEEAGLECKSTSALNTRRFKDGEFPNNYYCQCVHYLGVTEKVKWYLAVLIGNTDFKVYQLTRIENDVKPEWCESSVYISDEEIAALMNAEKDFFDNHIKTDVPPMADGSKATAETISVIYPESSEEVANLMAYQGELDEYMRLSQRIKELEEAKDGCASKIKAFMKDAGKGESSSYKVSWVSAEKSTFDAKRFKAEHPQMDLSAYYKKSSYRTFKVTERK